MTIQLRLSSSSSSSPLLLSVATPATTGARLAAAIGLPLLTTYLHIVLLVIVACELILRASLLFLRSPRAPSSLHRLSPERRADCAIRLISTMHALACVVLVAPLLADARLAAAKLTAWSPNAARAFAVSLGYFLWDAVVCLRYWSIHGPAFLMHGLACSFVYVLAFRPYAHYYGVRFLLYELSTPILNVAWVLDKLYAVRANPPHPPSKPTNPTKQTAAPCGNGAPATAVTVRHRKAPQAMPQAATFVAFAAVFFVVRIAGGFVVSLDYARHAIAAPHLLPGYATALLLLGCAAFYLLNLYWFTAILGVIRRHSKQA